MNNCGICNEQFEDDFYDKEQGKCILHCEKNNPYQIDDNNSKFFYRALIDYITPQVLRASNEYKTSIDSMEHQKTIIWNFLDNLDNNDSSFNIKEALKNKITLEDIIFPIYNPIRNEYNYTSVLNKLTNIEFKNCNFIFKIDLKSDTNLIFRECTFSGYWYHIFCNEIKYIACKFEDFIIDNISEDKLIVENHLLYNCGFKNIRCSGTKFKKRFFKYDNINEYKKIENIKLKNCEFEEDFILNITNNENKKELEYFEITNINFEHSIFHRKVKIQFCEIKEKASFFNTSFKDLADFYNTKFNKVIFERTNFEKIAVFSEVEFHQDVDFKYTKFLGKSIFRDTVIEGELDLRNTIFDDDANFLDITSQKRKKSYKDEYIGDAKEIKVSNRETARIIKNFYDSSNNIIEANKFYALEMEKREYELKEAVTEGHFRFILEHIIFKIHGITSNHSQDWFLSLLWILNITYIYSIYSFDNSYHNNMLATISYYSVVLVLFIYQNPRPLLKLILIISTLVFIFMSYISLDVIADKINPFSIMTSKDPITFGLLIFKITIAYLIYQFIVSLRQNTRRK